MNHPPFRSWTRSPVWIPLAIVLLTLLASTLTSSLAAAAPSSALPAGVPDGYSSRVLHVKFNEASGAQLLESQLTPAAMNAMTGFSPLFTLPERELDALQATGESLSAEELPDLSLWFALTLAPGTDVEALIEELRGLELIAVVEPAPLPAPPPSLTPDFTLHQGYLFGGPGGINASLAWTIPGGNGEGVTIYDVEYSWSQTHEDLSRTWAVSLLLDPGDAAFDPYHDKNHGTAVLGVLAADKNDRGVTGIAWGAELGLAPVTTAYLGYNPANAILLAAADGEPGDVILVEQQANVCDLPDGSYGPAEWAPAIFDAIQTATANGLVVVEAAGNGGVDLDQPACEGAFDRHRRDSGAIIAGAGQTPISGADRQREWYSSYGSRVDLQGWGGYVATTGYGTSYWNADDPGNPNFWYTEYFSGTSSAAPMVAGAVASLQGIALHASGQPLTAQQVRALLAQTGNPQMGNTSEEIGPRADLSAAILGLQEQPVANAGADQAVACTGPQGEMISLDGSASTDPNADALAFSWSGFGIDFTDSHSSTTAALFPVGTTTVNLVVNDGRLSSGEDAVQVVVEDHTAPTLSGEWIPVRVRQRQGEFQVKFRARDLCDPHASAKGVIAMPDFSGFEIKMNTSSRVSIRFDLEKQVMQIAGPYPRALLSKLLQYGGLPVRYGQFVNVRLKTENSHRLTFIYSPDGKLVIQAPEVVLNLVGQDSAGNSAFEQVRPVFADD